MCPGVLNGSFQVTSISLLIAGELLSNCNKTQVRTLPHNNHHVLFVRVKHIVSLNVISLQKKTMDDKWSFICENHICFGCLRKGHISKDGIFVVHVACAIQLACTKIKTKYL